MKEQIRSNEAMLGNTFEVARFAPLRRIEASARRAEWTPRMVDAELTTRPFPPTLGRERNIFMAEPGQSEIPIGRRQRPPKQAKIESVQKPVVESQFTPHTPEEKVGILQTAEMLKKLLGTPELKRQTEELAEKTREQEAVRQRREESKGVEAYGLLEGEPRAGGEPRRPSTFKEVPVPRLEEELQREQEEFGRYLREQGRPETPLGEPQVTAIRTRVESLRSLSSYVEANSRAVQAGLLDAHGAYNNLNEAIRRGEIIVEDAQGHLGELAQSMVERINRQGVDQRVQEIGETQDPQRKRFLLNEMIVEFDPDSTRQISIKDFQIIAEDKEAAEYLLDKIISRPLAVPTDHYELSFYANINLYTFFSEVRRIDPERFKRYAELKAATLIFHEMNRGITVESGNIGAFLGLTRSVTPRHLQTATELDGVELARQLTEEALGRLYTEKSETTGEKIDPEINGWVEKEFRKLAAGGAVKNKGGRTLEPWEIDRALAFGRNMHSSFYRKSELYSWSSVPLERQNWLNAPPTETVLRVLAGLKWLTYRFRYGEVGGGPALTALLYNSITKEYRDKNPKLEKIGKLNIQKDILPTGFFKSAGFDSGWRTMGAYLGSDVMRVKINPDTYSKSSDSVKLAISQFLAEEGLSKEGGEVNFGKFLIRQEYKARERFAREEKVGGVSVFREASPTNFDAINKQMGEVIEPIMEQVNLSLGLLIKYSGDEELRTLLWKKTADLLPLRIAYLLSDGGVRDRWVKNLQGYGDVMGEPGHLFSDDFESKLIKAQHLRIQEQKEAKTRKIGLDSFLDQAGMSVEEKQFVARLQELGRDNASELAKIPFPHAPFLEDVPFGEAKYTELPSEVFYRKMGSDFEGFFNAGNGVNNIVGNLSQPYPRILENLKGVYDGITAAESARDGQDIVKPILQSYLKLAEQWVWTRYIPFAKTTRGFLNLPTSWLQVSFGKDALSTDESTMRNMINQAVGIGVIRREKLPGEKKSQFDELAERAGARAVDVLIDQARTLSIVIALIMAGAFITITGKQVGEDLKKG